MTAKMLRHLFLILTIVALWFGVWGLLDEATDTLEEGWGVPKVQTYAAILAGALGFLVLRPEIIERF
jgi:hypothetical protein